MICIHAVPSNLTFSELGECAGEIGYRLSVDKGRKVFCYYIVNVSHFLFSSASFCLIRMFFLFLTYFTFLRNSLFESRVQFRLNFCHRPALETGVHKSVLIWRGRRREGMPLRLFLILVLVMQNCFRW